MGSSPATPTKIICSSSRESFVNKLYPLLSREAPLWYKNEACGVNGNEHTYRSAASRQSGIGGKKTPHQFCEVSMVEIEELSHDEIQRIVSEAGAEAVKKAFAAGLPVCGSEGDKIIKYFPDGTKKVIGKIEHSTVPIDHTQLVGSQLPVK